MAIRHGSPIREVVDWGAGERRRRRLEADLERIVTALPGLGVRRAILFGSLARGDVGGQSDLDLIFIADTRERFPERCRRFYETLEPRVGMDVLVYTLEEFEAIRGTSVDGSGRKSSQGIFLRSGSRPGPGTFDR